MNAGRRISTGYRLLGLLPLIACCAWLAGLTLAPAAHAEQIVGSGDYSGKWNGGNGSERAGDIVVNAGDVNDDGFDDLLTMVDGAANRGVYVLFGPGQSSSPDLGNLDPSQGYRIQTPVDAIWPSSVGDQNGDGVPDMVVATSPLGSSATVVYGVKNPGTDLAQCSPPNLTRCVSTDDPVDVNGNRLGFKLSNSVSMVATAGRWDSGDFDGDGKDELLAPTGTNGTNGTQAFVLANDLGSKCPAPPGLCTIDVSTLTAPDAISIGGLPSGIPVGNTVDSPGDVNGDGRDDVVLSSGTDGSVQPAEWVVYGQDWNSSPVDLTTLTSTTGYKISLPFTAISSFPFSPGDVNGDGIDDLGVQGLEVVPTLGTYFTVIYGKSGTPERTLTADPPAVGEGYQFDWDSTFAPPPVQGTSAGALPVSFGDLNGDGADEFGTSAPNAAINGKSNAGRVVIFQGAPPADQNRILVDAATPASSVITLGGDTASMKTGTGLASAGDIDGDGVNDLAIGASGYALTSPSPLSNVGLVGTLSSSKYFPEGSTGVAGVTGQNSATVSGVGNANRRDSIAYFEYGTTDSYGDQTADQEIGASGVGRGIEADLTGLDPDTEYHYRTVVMNDLGIKAYGGDRTFTTEAVPITPKTPCEENPIAAGCDKYCEANPTAIGCVESVAGLSGLIVSSGAAKVKRGGKVVIRSWITSTGGKAVEGLTVCASVPKKLVRLVGGRCRTIGNLAPGQTARAQFTIKVKTKARKGAKPTVGLNATANGLAAKTAKARFTVR